jgi:LysM domain-containing protein
MIMLTRALPARSREASVRGRDDAADGRSAARHPRGGGRRQRPRWPGRAAAAVALAAVVVAIVLVVDAHRQPASQAPQIAAPARPRSRHHFWIVRPNQTLSEIVSRTGVSLARIEQLNPRLNPGALQTGQLIRVRP